MDENFFIIIHESLISIEGRNDDILTYELHTGIEMKAKNT